MSISSVITKLAITTMLLCGSATATSLANLSVNLQFYAEDYPPSVFLENGKITGASVEILKLLWQELGQEPEPIYVVPWARGYYQLQTQANAVLFSIARSKQRETLFKWVGPLFIADFVVVTKKTLAAEKLTDSAIFNSSFALIRDDITASLLKQHGVVNLVESKSMTDAERMLDIGRIDMLAISLAGLQDLYNQHPEKREQYQIVYNLGQIGNYFAFNKQVPDSVVKRYQQAFDKLAPEIAKINAKYLSAAAIAQ